MNPMMIPFLMYQRWWIELFFPKPEVKERPVRYEG
jgi:hypothetical protein